MNVVIKGRTVYLPDTVETVRGAVLKLEQLERGSREEWVRLVYRARGTELQEAEVDPGFMTVSPATLDDVVAAEESFAVAMEVRELARLTRTLSLGGLALAIAYGGA